MKQDKNQTRYRRTKQDTEERNKTQKNRIQDKTRYEKDKFITIIIIIITIVNKDNSSKYQYIQYNQETFLRL